MRFSHLNLLLGARRGQACGNIKVLNKILAQMYPGTRVLGTTTENQSRSRIVTNNPSRSAYEKTLIANAIALFAATLVAGESEDVKAAAKKLAEQKNYSWKTTVVVPEGSQFRPGPTEGKTEKEGYTLLSMSLRDNTMEAVLKGRKARPRWKVSGVR